jgi:GNAT superfamily N-acetyltransferase
VKTKPIVIKNAESRDVHNLINLLEQLFAIETDFCFDPDRHRRGLMMMLEGCGRHRVVKTAWIDDTLVGMCTAQTRISSATGCLSAVLEDLVVDTRYRGRGAGTALLDAMSEWAQNRGIKHLSLLADRENAPGLKFYQRHQWKQTRLICLTRNLDSTGTTDM